MHNDPSDAEWTRFQVYAWRVRELYTTNEKYKEIAPSVWTFLSIRLGRGQGLLPRLVRLDGFDGVAADPGRLILLSPSIRYITMRFHSSPATSQQDLDVYNTMIEVACKATIPNLEGLRIERTNNLPGPRPPILPTGALVHLRELELAQMVTADKTMIDALMQFPHLCKLELAMRLELDPEATFAPGFAELHSLRVAGTPDDMARFLDATEPPRLTALSLGVTAWHPDAPPVVGRLHAALTHLTRAQTPSLTLDFDALCSPLPVLGAVLAPARGYAFLTHVAVRLARVRGALPVSHVALYALAVAWPALEVFELAVADDDVDEDVFDAPEAPDARVLVRFALHNPRLVRLTLPYVVPTWPTVVVDAEGVPGVAAMAPPADVDSDSDRSESPPPHPPWSHARELEDVPVLDHGLRKLDVKHIHVSVGYYEEYRRKAISTNTFELAQAIDRLFPHLELEGVMVTQTSAVRAENDLLPLWSEVVPILLGLQRGRQGAHHGDPSAGPGGLRALLRQQDARAAVRAWGQPRAAAAAHDG